MTTWTSYQGIEVIESHAAPARHPRWGYENLVALKGGTLLLLSDGTTLVVCDSCEYNGLTGYEPYVKPEGELKEIVKQSDSVLSHVNGKHRANRRTSLYTDDQIKVAIKIWLKWRGSNVKNWTKSACDELERRGFQPLRGEHWTPGQLGSLVRTYMKNQKFKNIKAAPMSEAEQGAFALYARVGRGSSSRDSAAHEEGKNEVARKLPRQHTRVDFKKIIADSEAARAARLKNEEEVEVPTGDSPNPTLNIVVPRGPAAPTKALVIDEAPVVVPSSSPSLTVVPQSDYEHVVELPNGDPMFKYKGGLMVGKPVKGVEV